MAKKLTSAKATEMLHNPPHGKPLTEKQRKFFGAIAEGAKPYKSGGWLDKFEDGGEYLGTTNKGFDYNGAWGGQWAMGGSLPGSTGMMYARTGAPSKGPRRNQTDVTDASAQNGMEMSYYQQGLDFKPKTISRDGSEIPQAQPGKNVPIWAKEIPRATGDIASYSVQKPRFTQEQLTVRKQQEDAKILADRKARIAAADKASKIPYRSLQTIPYQLAEKSQAAGDKFRLFPDNPHSFFDDYLNPGVFIGDLGSGLARVPLNLQQGNYGQAAWDVAAPAIAGAGEALLEPVVKAAGKYITTQTPLKNAYKLNPRALKENPEMFLYRARPVGQNPDMNMSSLFKAQEEKGQPLDWVKKKIIQAAEYPEVNPSIYAREKYYGRWFEKDPNRLDFYINPDTRNFADNDAIEILRTRLPKSEAAKFNVSQFDDAKILSAHPETEFILPKNMVNSAERFPESNWQKLVQEDKKFNTPHWLRGYKPIETPSVGNIDGLGSLFNKKYEVPLERLDEEVRLANLSETSNENAIDVYNSFKERIKTPEGKRRLKELGISEDAALHNIKLMEDPNTFGVYYSDRNKININSNIDPSQVRTVTRHEIEHGVQEAVNNAKVKEAGKFRLTDLIPFGKGAHARKVDAYFDITSNVDKELANLELKRQATPGKVWESNVQSGPVDAHNLSQYLSDKQRATDYFLTGSEGREKGAFAAEAQQYMLDKGYIKHPYEHITPEKVKEVMMDAYFDHNHPIRLFQIMKPNNDNYKIVASALNKMLGVVPPAVIGAGAAASVDQKKKGGKIKKDNDGYWNPDNWGKPVEIDSNDITMQGVYEPLLGISDTGDTQLMMPGEDYTFDGDKVTEYPVTNWLDKYN